jgi:hypothetical protein
MNGELISFTLQYSIQTIVFSGSVGLPFTFQGIIQFIIIVYVFNLYNYI